MAVGLSVPHRGREGARACGDGVDQLVVFRRGFHRCLTARSDALFELGDAVLCTDVPVKTLVGLSLAPEHRRGHGALYGGLNAGDIDTDRVRDLLAVQPLPRAAGGRIVLAVDVCVWLRPEAVTSPDRLFCHVYGRGKNQAQMIPGWPYSFVAAIEPGRTSWTTLLDVVRLGPDDDEQAVTAAQARGVIERLIATGQWGKGDPDILMVFDAGYDVARLGFALRDLPVQVLGRLRSDRVFYRPAPPHSGTRRKQRGRPVRHGGAFQFKDRSTWHPCEVTSTTQTSRYGKAHARAWDRMHPRLTHRAAWLDHDGQLPVLEGTVIQLQVDHLPGERDPKPLWLWTNATGLPAEQVDLLWQAFLRRFDLEHTFRFFKQTLGWTAPKVHHPAAADRWTWLLIACHTQLRLARGRAQDLRRPWEKPAPAGRLSPARVRRGFRNLHAATGSPAGAPKPGKPGPGRPPGSKNRHPATRYDVGKTTKRDRSITASKARAG